MKFDFKLHIYDFYHFCSIQMKTNLDILPCFAVLLYEWIDVEKKASFLLKILSGVGFLLAEKSAKRNNATIIVNSNMWVCSRAHDDDQFTVTIQVQG